MPRAAALVIPAFALLGGAGDITATAAALPVQEETREVSGFDEVALDGVGTLVIEQGDEEALTIEAEPHVLPLIATEVEANRLTIRPIGSFTTTEPITYSLTVKELHVIELTGSAAVEVPELDTDELRITSTGSGAVGVDQLAADALEVAASGAGAVAVAGAVTSQAVELDGAAAYEAAELESKTASVSADGAGRATVRVSDELDARVGGAGSVAFIGTPLVSQEVSGAGRVERIG